MLEAICRKDTALWKSARSQFHHLLMAGMIWENESKRKLAEVFTKVKFNKRARALYRLGATKAMKMDLKFTKVSKETNLRKFLPLNFFKKDYSASRVGTNQKCDIN